MKKAHKLSAAAAALAISVTGGFEGLRLKAYQDVVGVWTVCYGETKGVKRGDVYTKAQCDAMFLARLNEFNPVVDRCIGGPLSAKTRIAFLDTAYNIGEGAFCRSSISSAAKAGNMVQACNNILKYKFAGGRIYAGLVRRRSIVNRICLDGLKDAAE